MVACIEAADEPQRTQSEPLCVVQAGLKASSHTTSPVAARQTGRKKGVTTESMAEIARSAVVLVDSQHAGSLVLKPKEFSTGSRGFYGHGKLVIDGKEYQVGANVVEIGTKPKPKKA